jgi:hypothetical protein
MPGTMPVGGAAASDRPDAGWRHRARHDGVASGRA